MVQRVGKENGSKMTWDEDFKSLGRKTGQRLCSKTWHEGFEEFGKENESKILVQRLGVKASISFGRRTGQRFCSKTWDEGFNEFW